MNRVLSILISSAVVLWLLSYTVFIVDQRKFAVVSTMGEVRQVIDEPGLHLRLPPFQSVALIEKRIMMFETSESEHFATTEKNNQKMDIEATALVKWQIVAPKLNYIAVGGDEARAVERLKQTVHAALADEVGRHTAQELVSTERENVSQAVRRRLAEDAKQIGVEIVDVHVKRVDFPDQYNLSIYERMKAERERIAADLRAQGLSEKENMQAKADSESKVIVATATRDAEIARGEGDAKAAQIYSQAFGQNPEFYKFYQSLKAYRASFKNRSDIMVVDPNSEFFKYMKNPEALNTKK
ncbi:MAG TPA: protease modulator HflC [Burkholderiaceae bacterium]